MTKAQDMSDRAAALGFSAFFGRTGGYTFKRDTLDVSVGNLANADALLSLIEEGAEAKKSLSDTSDAFNAAISYALQQHSEGMTFLQLWNEGDWLAIAIEFPDFDLGENAPEVIREGMAGYFAIHGSDSDVAKHVFVMHKPDANKNLVRQVAVYDIKHKHLITAAALSVNNRIACGIPADDRMILRYGCLCDIEPATDGATKDEFISFNQELDVTWQGASNTAKSFNEQIRISALIEAIGRAPWVVHADHQGHIADAVSASNSKSHSPKV